MTTYIAWDYDEGIATRYNRIGKCNQCGDCCRGTIGIKLCDGDKNHNGGVTTNSRGYWAEVENGSKNREFIKFTYPTPDVADNFPFQDIDHCHMMTALGCALHGENKPWVCAVWPTTPKDIEQYPHCSYSFEKIESWEINEGEKNEVGND